MARGARPAVSSTLPEARAVRGRVVLSLVRRAVVLGPFFGGVLYVTEVGRQGGGANLALQL